MATGLENLAYGRCGTREPDRFGMGRFLGSSIMPKRGHAWCFVEVLC
jgi:hypothetical protein